MANLTKPDQLNTTHQFGLDWTFGDLTFNYKYANTFQDNRQVGIDLPIS